MKKIAILLLCFCFLQIAGEASARKKLHVAALAYSKEDAGLDGLLYSAKEYKLDVSLVGLGTKNATSAAAAFLDYLDKLDNDSVVLFLGNARSLILAGKKRILRKFYKIGKPVLFPTSKKRPNITPFPYSLYPISPTNFRYLSPDAMIGKVKDIKVIFYRMLEKGCFKTQNAINFDFIVNQNQYTLDYYNKMFLSLSGINNDDIRVTNIDNRVHVFSTCGNPVVIVNNQYNTVLFNKICKTLF